MTLETSRLQSGNPLILRFCAYQKYHLQQVVVVVVVVLVLVLSLLVDPPLTCFTR